MTLVVVELLQDGVYLLSAARHSDRRRDSGVHQHSVYQAKARGHPPQSESGLPALHGKDLVAQEPDDHVVRREALLDEVLPSLPLHCRQQLPGVCVWSWEAALVFQQLHRDSSASDIWSRGVRGVCGVYRRRCQDEVLQGVTAKDAFT